MLELFNVLVENCKVASCFFLVLMLLRPLTEKFFSQSWHYLAFRVNLLLFFIPIRWLSEVSAPLIVKLFPFATKGEVTPQGELNPYLSTMMREPTPQQFTEVSPINWTEILVSVWVAVGFCVLLWQVYCMVRLHREVKGLSTIQCPVIQKFFKKCKEMLGFTDAIPLLGSERIYSPVLVGLHHPKILLPVKKVQEKHLEYIFAHELTHLRRKDLWWKALLTPLTILYWWNPLVYLFHAQFESVLEYSCDEEVVKLRSHEERKCYGKAILESIDEEQTNPVLGVSFRTPEQLLETRLKKMLKFNKMKTRTKVLSGILMSAMLLGAAAPVVTSSVENASNSPSRLTLEYTDYKMGMAFSDETIVEYPDLSELKLKEIQIEKNDQNANKPSHYLIILNFEGGLPWRDDTNNPQERDEMHETVFSSLIVTYSDDSTEAIMMTGCFADNNSVSVSGSISRTDVSSISYLGTDFALQIDGKTISSPTSVNTDSSYTVNVETDKINEYLVNLTSVNASDEESFAPNVWARIMEKVESGDIFFFETRAEEQEWIQNNTITLFEEGKREWEAVEVHKILAIAPEDESNFTPEEWADILEQVEAGEILMMEASSPMMETDVHGTELILVDKIPFDAGADVISSDAMLVMVSVNKEDESRYSPEVWAEFMEKVETGEILLFETGEEEQAYCETLFAE